MGRIPTPRLRCMPKPCDGASMASGKSLLQNGHGSMLSAENHKSLKPFLCGRDERGKVAHMKFVKMLRDESGQAMIVSLLTMTVLLGVVGFAADVGTLLRAKRNLQIAADSAAVAGAAEINYADMTSAGQAAAAQNGVVIGTSGGAVTINTPPTEGAYTGQAGYVEAIVSQDQPTFFMNIFKIASQTVTARAVATTSVSTGCVYVLSPNGSPALELQGSSTLTAPNCGVIVDSMIPMRCTLPAQRRALQLDRWGLLVGMVDRQGTVPRHRSQE
jgi:Flp pilus assembly protein TadG